MDMNGDYFGLPTTILTNDQISLEFLSQAGPRIVRLSLDGSKGNLLKELPNLRLETIHGDYYFRGGHRLWHSPEDMPRSYLPDNEGLVVEQTSQGVRLTGAMEVPTAIQKSIEIHLHPDQPVVSLTHRLQNMGIWPVELAPWAITQVPLGGLAILPQTKAPVDRAGLLPNRLVALWPYTSWEDPRLQLHDDFILIQGSGKTPPLKLGYANYAGWLGYLHQSVLFCKKFTYQAGAVYPDYGSCSECYCDDNFLELETLGPLVRLEPGQSTVLVETWELYAAQGIPVTYAGIADFTRGLGLT
jgi:hypothetical protein